MNGSMVVMVVITYGSNVCNHLFYKIKSCLTIIMTFIFTLYIA